MTERTLLLVDDDENVAASLMRLLRRDGYKILRANGGAEGLEMLASNEIGVIISDQRMPGMTGVEFLSRVKEDYPDTIRIVLSGYTELNSVTDAINRGAIYKFLTKPWDDNLLRVNVEEAFLRYEMKLENIRLGKEVQTANDELLRINRVLEQRVEEKTHEAMLKLDALLVSQEILEHLPVAIIGVGEDGLIAVANNMARQIFDAEGNQPFLGEAATDVLPPKILNFVPTEEFEPMVKKLRLANGQEINFWSINVVKLSQSKGKVFVIDPVTNSDHLQPDQREL